MSNWQDANDSMVLTPLLTCIQALTLLWQRACEESNQQSALFEEWIQEVSGWAKLAEWKAELKQNLGYGDNLWLPSADAQELSVLLGIATLADGLGCTATQLAKAFMKLHLGDSQRSSQAEHSSDPPVAMNPVEASNVPVVEMNQKEEFQSLSAVERAIDYGPLVEALNDWQAMFELALDEAAAHVNREHFPAEDLSASLSEMCELLREVLRRNSGLYKSKVEVPYDRP